MISDRALYAYTWKSLKLLLDWCERRGLTLFSKPATITTGNERWEYVWLGVPEQYVRHGLEFETAVQYVNWVYGAWLDGEPHAPFRDARAARFIELYPEYKDHQF